MRDIDPKSAAIVMELWDTARYEGHNFYSSFGEVTLDRLFEIYPATQTVFGIQDGDEVFERKRSIHTKALVIIFDSFFQMLEQQREAMEDVLSQVGFKHAQIGVDPDFFPYMGHALRYSLEHFTNKKFDEDEAKAWDEVFGALIDEILKSLKSPK